MLVDFIDYLNKNAGGLTVLFTAVVTISTVAYAILTWKLVSETRRMREVQTEPKIEIVVKPLESAVNIVRLHIRNIGFGPATSVKFGPRLVSGGDIGKALLEEFTETAFFKSGLNYFGPGRELYSGYTQFDKNTDGKLKTVIGFAMEYAGMTGKKYKELLTVDMAEMDGTYQLGTPNLYSIAESMMKIQDVFSQVVSGFRKINVDVYTAEDRTKQREERMAHIEKRKKEKENS